MFEHGVRRGNAPTIEVSTVQMINFPVGDFLTVKFRGETKGEPEKVECMVVGNYPNHINVEITGKYGNYIRSINKIDLLTRDIIICKEEEKCV